LPSSFRPPIYSILHRSTGWVRSFFGTTSDAAITALVGQPKYQEYGIYVDSRDKGERAASAAPTTRDERIAIWAYTCNDGWFRRVNSELWEGSVSSEVTDFSHVLEGSLAKMFFFAGPVYRGYPADDLEEFLENYSVGSEKKIPAFTSTTKELEQAFEGNVLFVISARNGHDVERFSAFPSEREVMFDMNTSFRVLGVEQSGDSAMIELEQVDL
jgi:hypothetical protein